MKQQVELKVNISIDDVMDYMYQVTDSIYSKFSNMKGYKSQIYVAEKIMVEKQMHDAKISMSNIIAVRYQSGMFQPFGFTSQATSNMNHYTVILVYVTEAVFEPLVNNDPLDVQKKNIYNLFVSTPKANLKSLYRTLSLQFHPDMEGGSDDLMKYINSLKEIYSK